LHHSKSSDNDNYAKRAPWTALQFFISLLLIAGIISLVVTLKDTQKKLEDKCPDLELVEGVYKIK